MSESTNTEKLPLASGAGSAVPEHHLAAITELYRSAGVGDTVAHKLAFWNRENPNTQISHDPPDDVRVAIFETSWLCDQFPQDFTFC